MAKEARMGLTVIVALLSVFGYLLFRRLNRQEDTPVVAISDRVDAEAPEASHDGPEPSDATEGTVQFDSGAAYRGDAAGSGYEDWNSADDARSSYSQSAQQAVIQADPRQTFTRQSGQDAPDYSVTGEQRENVPSADGYGVEPAPFESASDARATESYATGAVAGGGHDGDSHNDEWNRYRQQDQQAPEGLYDRQGAVSDSAVAADRDSQDVAADDYRQDGQSQQLRGVPDAQDVLLPVEEATYEGDQAVQTAAAQSPSRAGVSSREYHPSRSNSSRGSTLPPYRATDYGQQQYSPLSQVPNFRESVLERSATTQTAPTGRYGPVQEGNAGFENTGSALQSGRAGGSARSRGQYVVQSKDNFWVISKRLYGTGAYFKALYEHNRGHYPRADQLRPGDVIEAPSRSVLEQTYPQLCPKQSRSQAASSSSNANVVQQTVGGRMRSRLGGPIYVVEKGDTLFDIARYELGSAARWGEIYELNRELLGDNVDYLKPGTELVLPPAVRNGPITERFGTTLRR